MPGEIKLPKEQFDILRQDDKEIHLYDKVVDKVYVYIRAEKKWSFPAGSRQDVIAQLTGFDPW